MVFKFLCPKKTSVPDYAIAILAFAGILCTSIIFKQMFIKVLPLFFSLAIMLVNAHANRIGFLLGAINALIYIIGYMGEKLYGSVVSSLFGAILQTITYFTWKKHAYKHSTVFRKLKAKYFLLLSGFIIASWIGVYFLLKTFGGQEALIDALIMVFGFVVPFTDMFAVIDGLLFSVINQILSVVLWVKIVTSGNTANLTYLIYAVYGFYMVVRKCFTWIKLYKEQKAEKEE